MDRKGGELIVFIIILTIFGIFLVLLFLVFLKRKNILIKSKIDAEHHFKQEIIKTQVEIREETLRNISWELHDNIGQLMTLAKIQAQNAKDNPEKIEEVAKIIAKGLTELRLLSKSINPETIKNINLEDAIKLELERFNKLNFLKTSFLVSGDSIKIEPNESTILFRILQEFFSNTVKHSKASELHVSLQYDENKLIIEAKDNGAGFNNNISYEGQGIKNMKSRANLIGAEAFMSSIEKVGTIIKLVYPYEER